MSDNDSASNDEKLRVQATVWGTLIKVGNLVVILLLPWAVWTTKTLYSLQQDVAVSNQLHQQVAAHTTSIRALDLAVADLNSWKNIAPRWTPTDAENLRLKVVNEIQAQLNASLADISAKLAVIQRDNLETQIMLKSHLAATNGR